MRTSINETTLYMNFVQTWTSMCYLGMQLCNRVHKVCICNMYVRIFTLVNYIRILHASTRSSFKWADKVYEPTQRIVKIQKWLLNTTCIYLSKDFIELLLTYLIIIIIIIIIQVSIHKHRWTYNRHK